MHCMRIVQCLKLHQQRLVIKRAGENEEDNVNIK